MPNRLYHILFFTVSIFQLIHAQLIVPFTQRPAQATPSQLIYQVRGDFQMIGNTNSTLLTYSENGSNNNTIAYVDVDNDATTWNSSMSNLQFTLENNASPNCTNIIYAGLYWSARVHLNDDPSPLVFSLTNANGQTKTFDKRQVKLKGPNSPNYSTITANDDDIYYPTALHGKMYSAYAEITDYVKQNGLGEYFVADLAANFGTSDPTGLYAGWSMVVIYENPQMNWRDITVFDGHSYVAGSITAEFEIPISGFQTSLSGPIAMKLGIIAGEGDRNIQGDFLEIRNYQDTDWIRLNHGNNSTSNFFNSSVFVGNINRNPNLVNNTGLDVSMFQIPNANNSVITNNQTQTRFKYGTTQDTFVIFNLTMSVNSYVSQIQEVVEVSEINGMAAPPFNQIAISPGDEITYKVNIYNTGNEAIDNYNFQTLIPNYTDFVANSIQTVVYHNQLPAPNTINFDASLGTNGGITWQYGQLYLSTNPEDIIATLIFKVKVKSGCFILPNANCLDQIILTGSSSGIGSVSQTNLQNQNLIIGFNTTNTCLVSPIEGQFVLPINLNYNLPQCATTVNLCNNQTIDLLTLIPSTWLTSGVFTDSNNTGGLNGSIFNTTGLETNFYEVHYEVGNGCSERFTIIINLYSDLPVISIIEGNCRMPFEAFIDNYNSNFTYSFTPSGPAVQSNGQIVNAAPGVSYIVYSSNGICTSLGSSATILLPIISIFDLEFYNYLSPNADGKNDSFNIKNYDPYCYISNVLQIYNRWGTLVFEKENYLHDADRFTGYANVKNAISQNDQLPEGTYFYIFRYLKLDNSWQEKNGWLYINKQ
jgi:uncharacterized repeat protein (TIGR01451 family)